MKALTDGAVFFDLLVPGYVKYPCYYYAIADEHEEVPHRVGQIVWLKIIPEPSNFTMEHINYDAPLTDIEE